MKKDKLIPKRRFKEFENDEAWEQRKFEEMLDNKNGVRRGPFGSALKKEYFVDDSDFVVYEQQNAIYDNYETRYKISKEKFEELSKFLVEPGDFIMSGAGTIGKISRVPKGINKGVFNQALIRFRLNYDLTDPEYFIQFIREDYMQRKLTRANPGSAITNLVPMSEVKKWDILLPRIEEQTRIGSFFKQLDSLITLHQRKLKKLKDLKLSYLSEMFPKEGEKYPRRRFEGFTEPWEKRKLGEIISWSRGNRLSKSALNNKKIGKDVIHYADLYKFSPVVNNVIHWSDSNEGTIIPENSLLFPMSDVTPIGLARTSTITKSGVKAGGDTLIGTLAESVHAEFMSYQINANAKEILPFVTGTTVRHISSSSLDELNVLITNTEEQKKIGNYFIQLGNLITLHQQKLEKLENIKKAYLNEMFI